MRSYYRIVVFALVVGPATAALPARAELYDAATLQQEDTRAQAGLEVFQTALGTPFLGLRAVFAFSGAAAGEVGNGALWLLDQPLPGTLPRAAPGWLLKGALRSVADDWSESTPGFGANPGASGGAPSADGPPG